jgi:hypothetical protein
MQRRHIFAADPNGAYLRETLCATRRHVSGEVEYHTKPVAEDEVSEELAACRGMVRRLIRVSSRRRKKAAPDRRGVR